MSSLNAKESCASHARGVGCIVSMCKSSNIEIGCTPSKSNVAVAAIAELRVAITYRRHTAKVNNFQQSE